MDLVTDLGTESGVMAGIHSSFCMIQTVTDMGLLHGINALKSGGTSCMRKNQTSWWMDFFNDLIAAGILSFTDQLNKKMIITR